MLNERNPLVGFGWRWRCRRRGEPKWQRLNDAVHFRLSLFLTNWVFFCPSSRSLKLIVRFESSGMIQGWTLTVFVFFFYSVKNMPVCLSAVWVWPIFSARDADLKSEQPSGHWLYLEIWFQAQLLSIWPKLFSANMNLSSEARRTAVNVTDKVSKGLNLDAIAEVLHTAHSGEWMSVAAAGLRSKRRDSIIKLMHSCCVPSRSLALDSCLLGWLTAPGRNSTRDDVAVDANGLFSSCVAEILITAFIIGSDITQSMGSSWIIKHFIKRPQTNDHTPLKSCGSQRAV